MLLWILPKIQFAFFAAVVHCWFIFSFLSTRTPRFLSARLLPSTQILACTGQFGYVIPLVMSFFYFVSDFTTAPFSSISTVFLNLKSSKYVSKEAMYASDWLKKISDILTVLFWCLSFVYTKGWLCLKIAWSKVGWGEEKIMNEEGHASSVINAYERIGINTWCEEKKKKKK